MKLFLCLLAFTVAASAAPGDPAEVALGFLEKVRRGQVNLEPGGDTALSPATGAEKRKQIAGRLERLARDLGEGKLEAGEVREESEHAGVLVYLADGFDPARLRAFPVALVKRGAEWQPAPVPASFENTGFGYPALLRDQLQALEKWMLRQQVVGLETLREKVGSRLRKEIETRIDVAQYADLTPQEVARRFLAACEERDLAAVLGYLGGVGRHLPGDWSARVEAADAALAADETPRPWRLLVAPEVIRAVVHEEVTARDGLVSIACLDPMAGPFGKSVPWVELVHLELSRSRDGSWQVDPPSAFLERVDPDAEDPRDWRDRRDDRWLDSDLLDRFPSSLREKIPAVPAESAQVAVDRFARALRAPNLIPLLGMLDLEGDPRAGRLGCARAARAWRHVNDPETPRHAVALDFHETGSAAVAMFHFFASREPDRADVKSFFFQKGEDGWMLVAGLRAEEESAGADLKAEIAWARERQLHWEQDWRQAVLAEASPLQAVAGPAPAAAEAEATVRAWLTAMADGDLAGAVMLTAILDDEQGRVRALRNFGYELSAALDAGRVASVDRARTGGTWATVAATGGSAAEPTFPLYVVVATPAGPRVLVETDLFAVGENRRTRNFLNKAALKRLQRFVPREAVDELSEMLNDHQASIDG